MVASRKLSYSDGMKRVSRTLLFTCIAAAAGACSSSSGSPEGGTPGNPDGAGGGGANGGVGSAGSMASAGSSGSSEGGLGNIPLNPGSGGQAGGAAETPGEAPVENVSFSVSSRTFEGSLSVTLEAASSDGEIRYTTDGSIPGPGSPIYTGGAIQVDRTLQLRAQLFENGVPVGPGSTALYVERTFDAASDLPLIIVDGYGGGKPEDSEVYADMAFMVFEPPPGRAAALSNLPSLATRGGYHVRGQSSAQFEKTPYRIELWDHASEDADLPLLGMPAEADFALIGPFVDRTLIRNAFVYSLGRDMGLPAPRYAFAEVYINYEGGPLEPSDYQGLYLVVETIKNHPERLDLKQLEPEDVAPEQLSGGYIFKFDWLASEEPTLDCSGSPPMGGFGGPNQNGGTCWTDLEVVDPEPLADAQAAWLTEYVQTFHDALHEGSFEQYAELMDVRSFVDVFIVNELTRNLDAYTRSAYYYKERDQPLSAGPLWDFNLTLGLGFGASIDVAGWQFSERQVASDWYRILGVDPDFLGLVAARWQELRQGLLSEAALSERINALAEPLALAAARDFERWPVSVTSNTMFPFVGPTDPTWEAQLSAARDWLSERLAWMDSQLPAPAP